MTNAVDSNITFFLILWHIKYNFWGYIYANTDELPLATFINIYFSDLSNLIKI